MTELGTDTGIEVVQDLAALTLTVTTRFDAAPERVWQVWADPRQLERWWGPPTYPATFVDHDLTPGGRMTYFMTGPEGQRHGGWWEVTAVDEPRSLSFVDGFSDESGTRNEAMPVTRTTVRLEPDGAGTVMVMVATFASAEEMERLVEMGMVEGLKAAMGQIPALLAT